MKRLKTKATMEQFEWLMSSIEEVLQELSVPQKTIFTLMTACDEIIVNIIHYAYPQKEGEIEIHIDQRDGLVRCAFYDEGIPFNPLLKGEADTTLLAHQREIGGLGIHMVRKLMDQVDYAYRDGKNVLTIQKSIPKS